MNRGFYPSLRPESYLLDAERQDEPLAEGRGELLVGVDEVVRLVCHVVKVEHVVQVAVLVGDDVEHHVAVLLVGIDVMEDHQSISVVLKGCCFPRLYIDDMKERLQRKNIGT